MKNVYILTGATGHLGSHVLKELEQKKERVRALVLEQELPTLVNRAKTTTYYVGDMTKPSSLEPLFQGLQGENIILIHMAALVDIKDKISNQLWKVNVKGTLDLMHLAKKYAVSKIIYISSVHVFSKEHPFQLIKETKEFSPDKVEGGYAKTKAEAANYVFKLIEKGLPAIVLFPSGIIGHDPKGTNNASDFVYRALDKKFPITLPGDYDFVDVRDVVQGIFSALEKGRIGEGYILSNRNYSVADILEMVSFFTKARKGTFLPLWFLKINKPLVNTITKLLGKKDIITDYSLHVLQTKDRFSHDKATKELEYYPRDLFLTIEDMYTRKDQRIL